jgi:tetratricopeptide (TPR) repeat protein
MEEMRIVARRDDDGLAFESYDAGQLFERGTALLNRGECRQAVEHYDRIAREFATSRYVAPALYNAGLCLHEGGELEAALPYYLQVIERAGSSRDGKHASLQLAQVYVGLERWADALALTDRLLLREDLVSVERLEGFARRAQALLGLERLDEAERQARDAVSYFRTRRGSEEIDEPYFAAAANFVLAETMRMRAERIELPPSDATTQHQYLESRARLVLDAQQEYFSTIRYTNPEWAAAAGYRIGAMYDALWHAMMSAPIPPPSREMNEATLALYRDEYRNELSRHIRPLMRHAIRYWEMTLLMVERTGVRSEWTERTRAHLERTRALLLEQNERDSEDGEAQPPLEQTGEHTRLEIPRLPERLRVGITEATEADFLAFRSGIPGRYGSSLTARTNPRT